MFNDLQEFAPKGSPQGNEASISLHDLLARGTAVHWDEAVAIVQEMCDVLIASSGDGASGTRSGGRSDQQERDCLAAAQPR